MKHKTYPRKSGGWVHISAQDQAILFALEGISSLLVRDAARSDGLSDRQRPKAPGASDDVQFLLGDDRKIALKGISIQVAQIVKYMPTWNRVKPPIRPDPVAVTNSGAGRS
jgi:hypothetical protein